MYVRISCNRIVAGIGNGSSRQRRQYFLYYLPYKWSYVNWSYSVAYDPPGAARMQCIPHRIKTFDVFDFGDVVTKVTKKPGCVDPENLVSQLCTAIDVAPRLLDRRHIQYVLDVQH